MNANMLDGTLGFVVDTSFAEMFGLSGSMKPNKFLRGIRDE
jgi:hypothetical protein